MVTRTSTGLYSQGSHWVSSQQALVCEYCTLQLSELFHSGPSSDRPEHLEDVR